MGYLFFLAVMPGVTFSMPIALSAAKQTLLSSFSICRRISSSRRSSASGRNVIGADYFADAFGKGNRNHHLIPGFADDFGAFDAAGNAKNRFAAFLGEINRTFAQFHAWAFGAVGDNADGGVIPQGFEQITRRATALPLLEPPMVPGLHFPENRQSDGPS